MSHVEKKKVGNGQELVYSETVTVNLYMTNLLAHYYHLGESTFILGALGEMFYSIFR